MVEKKELTLEDMIKGDILMSVNAKIKELESKKSSLENEIDKKREELSKMVSEVNKEIDQKIQKASADAQEKIFKANKILGEAELKLKTANKREQDSLVIEKQTKELDKKIKAFDDTEKELETLKVSCLEKEKKANLIIEQYNAKIKDLEIANKK